ncbi:MAG: GTP cyclohydrolase MptA [Candidatus Hodarchaeota archaeon]
MRKVVFELPDVQASKSLVNVSIKRVGIEGVKRHILREREGQCRELSTIIDAYVDLGALSRGIHMSRCLEVIDEVIQSAGQKKIVDTEELCASLARRLLERQEGATRAEINLKADYYLPRKTPTTGIEIQSLYHLVAKAVASKNDGKVSLRKTIGVEVFGITICPCAQQLVKQYAAEKLSEEGVSEEVINKVLKVVPFASHNQRGMGTLSVETDEEFRVEADALIDIVEHSMSAPIYELLKRPDEQALVINAHSNPQFVEDVVRLMLKGFYDRYGNKLPDDAVILARQVNFESVHLHNAFAEAITTLGELKKELEKNENNTDLNEV